MINLALVADGLIGNVQEDVMNKYLAGVSELMYYSKLLGCLLLFVVLIVTGEGYLGLHMVLGSPFHLSSHAHIFDCWLHWRFFVVAM